MTRTVAIIQARMSSSRFAGKVLQPLLNRPMIVFMVERVRMARHVEATLVATSTDPSDDPLEQALIQAGVPVYRGPLEDVLGRFVGAARAHGADHVVRLTGDCPLIDGDLIDATLELLVAQQLDYASNVSPPRWPDGLDVEAMTRDALESTALEAARPSEREHVTPFLRDNPQRFRQAGLASLIDLSALRWTVDHADDLDFVRRLLAAARVNDSTAFDRFDLLRALERHPALATLNRHQRNEGYAASLANEAAT